MRGSQGTGVRRDWPRMSARRKHFCSGMRTKRHDSGRPMTHFHRPTQPTRRRCSARSPIPTYSTHQSSGRSARMSRRQASARAAATADARKLVVEARAASTWSNWTGDVPAGVSILRVASEQQGSLAPSSAPSCKRRRLARASRARLSVALCAIATIQAQSAPQELPTNEVSTAAPPGGSRTGQASPR